MSKKDNGYEVRFREREDDEIGPASIVLQTPLGTEDIAVSRVGLKELRSQINTILEETNEDGIEYVIMPKYIYELLCENKEFEGAWFYKEEAE